MPEGSTVSSEGSTRTDLIKQCMEFTIREHTLYNLTKRTHIVDMAKKNGGRT